MAPRFYVNGTLAGSGPVAGAGETNVVQFGTITMKSPFLGEIKCQALVGAPVSNESERGVAPVDGWETWNCRMPDCLKGSASVTAAKPLQLIQYENPKKEIVIEVIRPEPRTTLPWSAEMTERERLKLFRMGSTEKQPPAPVKFWVDCPGEGLEVPYEGELAPIVHNGTKNGLKPSQMEFEGNGGRTGHLLTPDICGGECEQADLFLSGQLTILGTMQQLITAE
jgi:hypothetical protein